MGMLLFKIYSQLRLTILLLAITYLVGGCAFGGGGDPIDPKRKDLAVVFGYIDMEDAPGDLDWIKIKQYKTKPDYYSLGAKEGIFWHVGVDMGSYQVEKFGTNPGFWSRTSYSYNFGTAGRNQTARRIKKPGVYYLGSYKYINEGSKNWYSPDRFSMKKLKNPSEKELLIKILKFMKDDSDLNIYKHQMRWIKQRIAAL